VTRWAHSSYTFLHAIDLLPNAFNPTAHKCPHSITCSSLNLKPPSHRFVYWSSHPMQFHWCWFFTCTGWTWSLSSVNVTAYSRHIEMLFLKFHQFSQLLTTNIGSHTRSSLVHSTKLAVTLKMSVLEKEIKLGTNNGRFILFIFVRFFSATFHFWDKLRFPLLFYFPSYITLASGVMFTNISAFLNTNTTDWWHTRMYPKVSGLSR
jgi:hypothetical protein